MSIDMSIVKVGDVLVFNDSTKVTVETIEHDDNDMCALPYKVNNLFWLSDKGQTDPFGPKSKEVMSVAFKTAENRDLKELLSIDDLPDGLMWAIKTPVRREKDSKYQPLINFLKENRHRGFTRGEMAIVWYRLTGEIVKPSSSMMSAIHWFVKTGVIASEKKAGVPFRTYRYIKK